MSESDTLAIQAYRAPSGARFLMWYWSVHPRKILRMYASYAQAFGEMFSIIFLLKTLFAPWKSIRDAYPKKGFDISAILETWTLNVTARSIGCIIRIAAILVGIVLQVIVLAFFLSYLALWLAFPLLVVALISLSVLPLL